MLDHTGLGVGCTDRSLVGASCHKHLRTVHVKQAADSCHNPADEVDMCCHSWVIDMVAADDRTLGCCCTDHIVDSDSHPTDIAAAHKTVVEQRYRVRGKAEEYCFLDTRMGLTDLVIGTNH